MKATMGRLNFVNPWSWYSIAASIDVSRGQILPIALSGTTLLAWRAQNDKISVWSDRCPHRGMRLCLGGTRDDVLMCPYHGWVFGSDGACVHIPAHPSLTPTRAARARIYPCTESNGYIWACIGEPSTPAPVYSTSEGNALVHVRTIHVAADVETVAAALVARSLLAEGGWNEDLEWSGKDAHVEVQHTAIQGAFTARLEFPGLITCTAMFDDRKITYTAMLQPTSVDNAAIHLSLNGSAPAETQLMLNRNLVRLRRDLQARLDFAILEQIANRCADTMPDQIRG